MSHCSFDEEGFSLCCQLLLRHSDSLGDGWSWEQGQHCEEGYLKKTSLRRLAITSNKFNAAAARHPNPALEEEVSAGGGSGVQSDLGEEDACVPGGGGGVVLQYEYHVVFSCSFGVPVLYFRVSDLGGRSLCLDQVWDLVRLDSGRRLQQSPWNTITQQEHPLLGQPFFALHPCRTDQFMGPVVRAAEADNRKVNYVVTWLSVVGPLVGLELALSYSTLLAPAP